MHVFTGQRCLPAATIIVWDRMEYPISHKRKCACINAWLLPIFILLLVSTIVNIYIEYFAYYCGLTFIKVKSDFIIFCLYQWFHDRNIDPELTYRFPSQVQLPGSYRSIPADHKLFHVIPTTVIRSPDIWYILPISTLDLIVSIYISTDSIWLDWKLMLCNAYSDL